MSDASVEFDQYDISNENGPVNTRANPTDSKTEIRVHDFDAVQKLGEISSAVGGGDRIEKWEDLLLSGTTQNMNIDGSATPQDFQWAPGAGEIWYLKRWAIVLGQPAGLMYSKFENHGALTNGLKMEIRSKGSVNTVSILKQNPDIQARFFEGSAASSAKQGYEGVAPFDNIKLSGDQGDYVKMIVQDDLRLIAWLSSAIQVWKVLP